MQWPPGAFIYAWGLESNLVYQNAHSLPHTHAHRDMCGHPVCRQQVIHHVTEKCKVKRLSRYDVLAAQKYAYYNNSARLLCNAASCFNNSEGRTPVTAVEWMIELLGPNVYSEKNETGNHGPHLAAAILTQAFGLCGQLFHQ